MGRINVLHHALNVGVFDADKLHRVDLERMRLAAERQTNVLCDTIGKGYSRPGFEHITELDGFTRPIPFLAGGDEAAMLLFSDEEMRVFDQEDGALVSRPAVTATVPNGDFSSAGSWASGSSAGASDTISGGKLRLSARAAGALAVTAGVITVNEPGTLHALRVVVSNGPVRLKLNGVNDSSSLFLGDLRTGVHSIAFTPAINEDNVVIRFENVVPTEKTIDSCQIEAAGPMVIPTIWPASALPLIRCAQSLDVMYVACAGHKEQRIERYGDQSWSVVDYDRADGPFEAVRNSYVTLAPSVLEGNGTLTSSYDFFTADHVGALFRLFHEGQKIDTYLAGDGAETQAFLVSGITETNFEDRKFTTQVSGTWSGTLKHRRSYSGEFGDYVDYRREQASSTINITSNATYTNDDNDDNLDIWVKVGFAPGAYTSGEARVRFTYQGGGGFGIARVTGYTDSKHVSIEVLVPFKDTSAVENWRESRWDGYNGYPSAVGFVDGRLAWGGDDLFDASISDAFDSFDENFEGDAGPISRSIGLGGRNNIRWMLPLSSLLLGCDARIANARASSLDEVITPDNFGFKSSSKIGAAAVSPAELSDDRAVFVQASGNRLFELLWSAEKARYTAEPFSKLTTRLFDAGITGIAVQTLPDQRLWVTTLNGDAVCIVFEPSQEVLAAHVPISTSSDTDFFQYFEVLPALGQDRLYAVIKRVVDGATVYHFERMALDSEVEVDTLCKVMDGHVSGTGAHSATIGGLVHLEGRTVVAWVDGAPVTDPAITDPAEDNSMTFVVSGGEITLPDAPTEGYVVGLPYDYQYKSARLAYGVQGYTPMLQNKSLTALGLLLSDYCRSGVRYGVVRGSGFSTPWSLPQISSHTGDVAADVVAGIDEDEYKVGAGSEIGLDVRLCIAGRSPKPLAIRSIVLAIETHG